MIKRFVTGFVCFLIACEATPSQQTGLVEPTQDSQTGASDNQTDASAEAQAEIETETEKPEGAGSNQGSEKEQTVSVDAGTDAAVTDTLDKCLSKCEKDHQAGSVLAKAIDKCWETKCNPSCTEGDPTGKLYTPTVDASACGAHQIQTPFQTCSNCTVTNCCAAWKGCFDNADCTALNDCSSVCYDKFPPK